MRHILFILALGALLGVSPTAAQSSLQARVDAAAAGDTLLVDGGTHEGPVVVEKAIVLLGRNEPHVRGNDSTHVVVVEARDVTIQGFYITDSGKNLSDDHAGILVKAPRATIRDNRLADVLHGVYVKGVNRAVIVENVIEGPPTVPRRVSPTQAEKHNCSVPPTGGICDVPLVPAQRGNGVHLWKTTHNTITHNTVHHTRDGVYFSFTDHSYVAHNTIHDVRYGLHFMYSDDNVFEQNRFSENASGSALMFSFRLTARQNVFHSNRSQRGYGLLLQTMDESHFVNNRLTENGTGIYVENSTRNVFEQNVVAANYRGLRFTGSSMENQFSRNTIRGNLHTAAVAGASGTNEWQMNGVGNYWGPRGLLDVNADGISELPYRTVDVLGGRRETFAYVDLLAASPGLTLLEEAVRRVSSIDVPAITDDRPLMRSPTGLSEVSERGRAPILAFLLTLLAVGLAVLWRNHHD